jgi:integrase/recombinase XerD
LSRIIQIGNIYIRRHSALTDKSKFLKEATLRQHAGWSGRSQMHLKYLHYFGNESNNSILQEYGILSKDNAEEDVLRPKQCPNCSEPNRPDQKFCVKCKLALTFEAHVEKEDEIALMRAEMEDIRNAHRELQVLLTDPVQLKKALEES